MSNNDDDFYNRYTAGEQHGTSGEDSSTDWPDLHAVGRQHAAAGAAPHNDSRFDPEQTAIVTSDFVRASIRGLDQLPPDDQRPDPEHHLEQAQPSSGAHHAPDPDEVTGESGEDVDEEREHRWLPGFDGSPTNDTEPHDDRSPSGGTSVDETPQSVWDPPVRSPDFADHYSVSQNVDNEPSRAAHSDRAQQYNGQQHNPPSPEAYGWDPAASHPENDPYRRLDNRFQPPFPGAPITSDPQSYPHDAAPAWPPASDRRDEHANVVPPQWRTPHNGTPLAEPPQTPPPGNWQYPQTAAHDGRGPTRYPGSEHPGQPGQRGPGGHPQYGPLRQTPSSSVGVARAAIRESELVRPHKPEPTMGWRKILRKLTRINLGPSPAEREWIDLQRRIKSNLRGTYVIAVMGEKGGVSKTTTTIGLGQALAHYRDDKVVAVDGNTAKGNLADRIDEPSKGTWQTLLRDGNLNAYSDFRFHLGKDNSSGLEVLASDHGDEVITGWQLDAAIKRLGRQYPVTIVDCGNQLRDDVTAAILSLADAIVIVSTTNLDGAKGAGETINFLLAHGYPHLVHQAVVVISNVSKVPASKAVRHLHEDFERVVRAVHAIPYDPHLHEAAAIDMTRLQPATRRAFIEAAASVGDGFTGAADRDQSTNGPAQAAERRR